MQLTVAWLVLVSCIGGGHVLQLPSYLKPCSRNDPNLDECALSSGRQGILHFVKGDPKYHIPNMDPLMVDRIVLDNGATKSQPVSVKIVMTNVRVFGIPGNILNKITIDLKNKRVSIHNSYPRLTMLHDYEVTGRILILPIVGRGPGNITMVGLNMTFTFTWDLKLQEDGKQHIAMKDPKVDIKFERVFMHLDNLFGGNKMLGDNMNVFMNNNWEEVVKDVGPAVEDAFNQITTKLLDGLWNLVPYDEIFPDIP